MTPYHFFYVYVLQSLRFPHQTYIGFTRDLKKRFKEHNDGGSTYTRRFKPWTLLYYEAFSNQLAAEMRETSLKRNGNPARELKKRIGIELQGKKVVRGFTLPEVLVVISILGVVSVALAGAIVNTYRGSAYVFEAAASVDNARRALTTAVQNLREASYGEDGAYPIAAAATSTVTFYADVDQDGPVERVRMYLTNETLYRGVTNPTGNPPSYVGQPETVQTVVGYVRNDGTTPLFTYYDAAGMVLTSPVDISQVAFITMDIRVDLNPQRAPNVYALTGSATLRNLRTD